jgi:hypothetical protein
MTFDFSQLSVLPLIPASNQASSTNSPGQDTRGFIGMFLAVLSVAAGTGTLAVKIQDSADNAAFADCVPPLNFTGITTVASEQVLQVPSGQYRRYLRGATTIVTGPYNGISLHLIGLKQVA